MSMDEEGSKRQELDRYYWLRILTELRQHPHPLTHQSVSLYNIMNGQVGSETKVNVQDAVEIRQDTRGQDYKENTNSTQNKSQTHRAKQYEVTSFLSTDCELSTETCSKNVYSLVPRTSFASSLPGCFHHPIKKTVETMQVLKRGVTIKGKTVYDLETVFGPSSLIDQYGCMRKRRKGLLEMHSLSGSDTVSNLNGRGKVPALQVLTQTDID